MEYPKLSALVSDIRNVAAHTKVGLWRMPVKSIGEETKTAILLGVQPLDISNYFLVNLPSGAEFARLSYSKIIQALDSVANAKGPKDCVLIYNLDLLLAGVTVEDRAQVWKTLFNGFPHRPRALLIAVPETAEPLLPSEQLLEKWQAASRLV